MYLFFSWITIYNNNNTYHRYLYLDHIQLYINIISQLLNIPKTPNYYNSYYWNVFLSQIQDVVAITSYDKAGSFLLLGCENGSVYYIGKC